MLVMFGLLVLRLMTLGLFVLARREVVAAVTPVVIALYAPVAVGSAARLQRQGRGGSE